MAATKTLINRTGHDLQVVLTIRKGDHPKLNCGTVEVRLTAAPDKRTPADHSRQAVTYGNDIDIYLNGIEATLIENGSVVTSRELALTRGSSLDYEFNSHDTIEFLYDGEQICVSPSHSKEQPFTFPAQR